MGADDSFGFRLSRAMKRAGVRNREVADAAGVHVKTVSYWRNDRHVPEEAQLGAVVQLLNQRGVSITSAQLRYGEVGSRGSIIAEAMLGGPEAAERLKKERLWLARFRAELVEIDATDDQIGAAEALVQAPEAARFFGDVLSAMQALGALCRTTIVTRQLQAARDRDASQAEQLEIIARFPRDAFVPVSARAETAAPGAKHEHGHAHGGAHKKRRRGNG